MKHSQPTLIKLRCATLAGTVLGVAAALLTTGCDSLNSGFKDTPVGGVVSGNTTNSKEYLQQVEDQNRERQNQYSPTTQLPGQNY